MQKTGDGSLGQDGSGEGIVWPEPKEVSQSFFYL